RGTCFSAIRDPSSLAPQDDAFVSNRCDASRLALEQMRHFSSTSVKLNDASGITYTPDSFLLCADNSFSTTSGAHGASFHAVCCASLYSRAFSALSIVNC